MRRLGPAIYRTVHTKGGLDHTQPDLGWPHNHRARHGICPTPPCRANCPLTPSTLSRAGKADRVRSRMVVNAGGVSAINLPLSGDIQERCPLPSVLCPPCTACPKTLSGPSIRAHRRIGGTAGCGAMALKALVIIRGQGRWHLSSFGVMYFGGGASPADPCRATHCKLLACNDLER